jgi:predicted N-acetyltransferase YhbS
MRPVDVPAGYPLDLVETAYLADGTEVTFRPIVPADAERLRRLFHRLSPQSLYQRFFVPVTTPDEELLHRLATVDYDERLALVAVVDDEIVGVARFDRSGFWLARPDSPVAQEAEAAVIVEDAWQGRGLATRLLWRLSAAARDRGVRAFTAGILGENRPMMGLLDVIAEDVEVTLAEGEYTIRIWLDRMRDPEA